MMRLVTKLKPPILDSRILTIRGEKVMMDADLAGVYGVTTKALNQAVGRNTRRFPRDFRFQLSVAERAEVVTNCDHLKSLRFSPVRPWVFTEHGAIMAASVLKSRRAVDMSVFVVRAFIRLRALARSHGEISATLDVLERRVSAHDDDLLRMFAAIRRLFEPPRRPRRRIGFK